MVWKVKVRLVWPSILLMSVIFAMGVTPVSAVHEHGDTLIADWRFNETGGDLIDHSGNELHGDLRGGVTRGVPGANNSTAYRFDGEDDWVFIAGDPVLDPGETVSLEAWFRPRSFSTDYVRLFQRGRVSSYGMLVHNLDSGTELRFVATTDSSYGDVRYGQYYLDQWTHAVGTYNGTHIRLYIDGQQVLQEQQTGTIRARGYGDTAIAAWPTPSDFFHGDIDEMRIYDEVLSPGEVDHHYSNPPGWDPSPESGTENDTTSDNETDTDNETTSDNQTEGDTSDNDTLSDNSTTDNETTSDNDTTDDDTLFTGGNGTSGDGGFDSGATGNNTTGSNRTYTGNQTTNETTMDNETDGTDGTEDTAEGISLDVQPGRISTELAVGSSSRVTLSVANGGSQSASIRVDTVGLAGMLSVENERYTVPADSAVTVPVTINAEEAVAGEYTGSIRFIGDGVSRITPVEVTVVGEDTPVDRAIEAESSTYIFENDGRVIIDSYTDIYGTTGSRVNVTTIISDEEGRQLYRKTDSYEMNNQTVVPLLYNQSLPTGNYSFTLIAESSDGRYEDSKQFTVTGTRTGESEPAREQEDTGFPVIPITIVAALLIAGAGFYFRGTILEHIPRRLGPFQVREEKRAVS